MKNRLSAFLKKPWARFAALLCCAAALQGIFLLWLLLPWEAGAAMYALSFLTVLPALSALLPWWAARGGVHPLAACLPMGGLPTLLASDPWPWIGPACILISLVAATAGQEWEKRKQSEEQNGQNQTRRKKRRA